MNKLFLPTEKEEKAIRIIQKYHRENFALVRMTETMLKKSIIDASFEIRLILKDAEIIDYSEIEKGPTNKVLKKANILKKDENIEVNISFYRPKTKKGDPRFWVYKLTKYVKQDDLVYFTIKDGNLVVIPLNLSLESFEKICLDYLKKENEDKEILNELIDKLSIIKDKHWIKSINPLGKVNPRDAGDTLESLLGIEANNFISPDYRGKIEIKTKVSKNRTSDTLFSCVPDWNISEVKSSKEMILKYGYPSRKEKYLDYIDLYVSVNHKANNQGLFLETIDEELLLAQKYKKEDIIKDTCSWRYENLKERLINKHPKTVWILAEHKIIEKVNYFYYHKLELTQNPIFSQFLLLIEKGDLTFDWRGRVKFDGKGYKDKGHAFRLKSGKRNLLFGETEEIIL